MPLDIYVGVVLVERNSLAASFIYPVVSFSLDFVAVGLDAIGWYRRSLLLAFTSATLAIVSVEVGGAAPDLSSIPGLGLASKAGKVVAGVAAGAASYDVASDFL